MAVDVALNRVQSAKKAEKAVHEELEALRSTSMACTNEACGLRANPVAAEMKAIRENQALAKELAELKALMKMGSQTSGHQPALTRIVKHEGEAENLDTVRSPLNVPSLSNTDVVAQRKGTASVAAWAREQAEKVSCDVCDVE